MMVSDAAAVVPLHSAHAPQLQLVEGEGEEDEKRRRTTRENKSVCYECIITCTTAVWPHRHDDDDDVDAPFRINSVSGSHLLHSGEEKEGKSSLVLF